MGLILWPDSGDATATPVNINSDFTVNTRFMALNSVPITPPKKRKGTYNCGRSSASYPFEASYIHFPNIPGLIPTNHGNVVFSWMVTGSSEHLVVSYRVNPKSSIDGFFLKKTIQRTSGDPLWLVENLHGWFSSNSAPSLRYVPMFIYWRL